MEEQPECTSYFLTEWQSNFAYKDGDVVSLNGDRYRCFSAEWCAQGDIYKPDSLYGSYAWKLLLPGESVDWTQDDFDPSFKYRIGQEVTLLQYVLKCINSEGYCANPDYFPLGPYGHLYWEEQSTKPTSLTCQDGRVMKDNKEVETVNSVRSLGSSAGSSLSGSTPGHSADTILKNGFSISNCVLSFSDENLNRLVRSSTPLFTEPQGWTDDQYLSFANVQRVERILGKEGWNFLFPYRKSIYSYSGFLKAVAKYPKFCDEKAPTVTLSLDDVCRKELATMFAHYAQETGKHDAFDQTVPEWRQSLYYITEIGCPGAAKCSNYTQWSNASFPPTSGQLYFGRGPKQLSWNYNYGRFSRTFLQNKQVLLDAPDRVASEGWLALGSSLWFFMTPQAPKPSIHDVVTGFWTPNSSDAQTGVKAGFGLTTYIVNGGQECGSGWESVASQTRASYYESLLEYFNLKDDILEPKGCANLSYLPGGGAGDIKMYWDKNWSDSELDCHLVTWQTLYSILEPTGYSDCVKSLGGSVLCETSTDSTGPSDDNTSALGDSANEGSETNPNSGEASTGGTLLEGGKMRVEEDLTFTILDQNLNSIVEAASPICGIPEVNLSDLSSEPPNVQRFARILSKTEWDFLTPMKKDDYTYEGLVKAVKKFPKFCNESGLASKDLSADDLETHLDEMCKREISSIFAHFAQETGYHDAGNTIPEWRQSFYYVREIGCPGSGKCSNYTAHNHQFYPPVSGQTYYGRGAKQLSWNYNYGQYSKAILGNKHYLLVRPDRVASDPWLNIGAAMWFYMTPQAPKPSMHDVMVGKWLPDQNDLSKNTRKGFGTTTFIINGAQECGWGYESYASERRGSYFEALLGHFGMEKWPDEVLGCGSTKGFGGTSSESLIYFDRDWAQSTPTCKLVSWFTEFIIFYEDSYSKCVKWVAQEDYEPGRDLDFLIVKFPRMCTTSTEATWTTVDRRMIPQKLTRHPTRTLEVRPMAEQVLNQGPAMTEALTPVTNHLPQAHVKRIIQNIQGRTTPFRETRLFC